MLVGSTLLYISADLRWWSGLLPHAAESYSLRIRAGLITRLLLVAGSGGYYLCFVRRNKRSRFPFYIVFIPPLFAFAAVTGLGAYWITAPGGQISIIAQATDKLYFWHAGALKSLMMGFGTGFWIAGLGFLLVVIFSVLLYLGQATLPLRLLANESSGATEAIEFQETRQRTGPFVWMMISLLPLATFLVGLPFFFALVIPRIENLSSNVIVLGWLDRTVTVISLFVLIFVAMGGNARKSLRGGFRFPAVAYLGISILIPAAIATIWPTAHYAYDRIHWAAFAFGLSEAPQLKSYFGFPIFTALWLVIPALVEEIAWRGFLQPRLIREYGTARGIFFVGIVWGAFHFSGDFHPSMTVSTVLVALVHRFCITVALSYVLAWLTIRSKSILPAALTHGFYNIFLQIPTQTPFFLLASLWAILGWILFRYFPPKTADQGVDPEACPAVEAAI
jgi:membrane protease YdiL (CAAX protease family)